MGVLFLLLRGCTAIMLMLGLAPYKGNEPMVGVNGFPPGERSCRGTLQITAWMEDADAASRPEADPAEEKSVGTAVQVTDQEPAPSGNCSPPAAEER